jgi:hypothetical protein
MNNVSDHSCIKDDQTFVPTPVVSRQRRFIRLGDEDENQGDNRNTNPLITPDIIFATDDEETLFEQPTPVTKRRHRVGGVRRLNLVGDNSGQNHKYGSPRRRVKTVQTVPSSPLLLLGVEISVAQSGDSDDDASGVTIISCWTPENARPKLGRKKMGSISFLPPTPLVSSIFTESCGDTTTQNKLQQQQYQFASSRSGATWASNNQQQQQLQQHPFASTRSGSTWASTPEEQEEDEDVDEQEQESEREDYDEIFVRPRLLRRSGLLIREEKSRSMNTAIVAALKITREK